MLHEQILHGAGNTFSRKIYPQFTMPWHFHQEYELILITSGRGKRFVGDAVEEFRAGELVLIGENLPHFHLCDGLHFQRPEQVSSSQVIQFTRDIFPDRLEQFPEFSGIADLLERSRRGIRFTTTLPQDKMERMMARIDKFSGIRRISELMRILDLLSKTPRYRLLATPDYVNTVRTEYPCDPIDRIMYYLHTHFREPITLEDIAKKVNMHPASLCRYFRKRAQCSLFDSLNEIRIGYACKLLVHTGAGISQIAYEAGFRNIANFNRRFRAIKQMSPSSFRRSYQS